MSGALLIDWAVLVDDRRARAAVVSWAVAAYPVLEVTGSTITSEALLSEVSDPFTTDEALVAAHLTRGARAPLAAVEPSLIGRMVAERRYGAQLYAEVVGEPPLFWQGEGVVGSLAPRDEVLSFNGPVIVLSPRDRVETMLGLLATGWSEQIAEVVCDDAFTEAIDRPMALLEAGVRRVEALDGQPSELVLRSDCAALCAAGERLGLRRVS